MTDRPGWPVVDDTPVLDAENPWPGLAPFTEDQSGFFHGRRREVEDLYRLVRLNLLTVLYGQSGLGKTSLLQAALFPRLRTSSFLPVPIRLDYSASAPPPRAQIARALATAVGEAHVGFPPVDQRDTLWEHFHRRDLVLKGKDGRTVMPVLVFDQFEELFTLGAERADGRAFVRDCVTELASLIENHPPDRVEARFERDPALVARYDFDRRDHRILLSLREDYLAHLHDLSSRIPSLALNNMRLAPLDGARALEAVEKPGGRLVARGAAEAIVRFVAGSQDRREHKAEPIVDPATGEAAASEAAPIESLVVDPSLLCLFCRELNQKRREEHLSEITPQLVAANREDILKDFYARALGQLPPGVQEFVEEDLLTESGFREMLTVEAAESRLRNRGAGPEALKALVDRRLLHYEQRGHVTRVELTHDVLAPVVRQSRAVRREREAIAEAEARKRHELEENERRAQAARAEAERRYQRSRRQRRLIGIFSLGMAAVAAVAVWQSVVATRVSRALRLREAALTDVNRKVSEQNAILAAEQQALQDTTAIARMARDTAQMARAKASAMLVDFCEYTLKVVDRLGDSTAGNRELTGAYKTLVETSDSSVELMVNRSPEQVCPRRLETRIESIWPGLLLALNDTVRAREHARKALAAAHYLESFSDPLSREVLRKSYGSLAYDLYFAGDYPSALAAARAGLRFAAAADPRADSLASDKHARLYHYGALALIDLKRLPDARAWVDSGLAVVRRGLARNDQNRVGLYFTESQLHLRDLEIAADASVRDADRVVASGRAAAAAARARTVLRDNWSNRSWLAKMHRWRAERARQMSRYAEALEGVDSSSANWAVVLRTGSRTADTSMVADALSGITQAATVKASVLGWAERYDLEVLAARGAVDTARMLVGLSGSFDNRRLLSAAYHELGWAYERSNDLRGAETAYRDAARIDSVAVEGPARTALSAARDLDSHLLDLLRVLTPADSSAGAGATLRTREERRRGPREMLVWVRRRIVARDPGKSARDDLAVALGNLSWTYLLLDRPEPAAGLAREGMTLSPEQTYILPNYFNAVLLSGQDEDAGAFFRRYARTDVEDPKVPFPCATVRDIRQLRDLGVATDRHVEVTTRLVAASGVTCPNPAR